MHKSSQIVFGIAVAVVVATFSLWTSPEHSLADDPKKEAAGPAKLAEKLIGTWKLEEAKTPGSPSGIGSRLKFFTGTHWVVTQPDPKTGEVLFHHGGRYTVEGETVKTTTDFAGESTKGRIGTTGSYQTKVDGDTLLQVDANGVYNETWKRVK